MKIKLQTIVCLACILTCTGSSYGSAIEIPQVNLRYNTYKHAAPYETVQTIAIDRPIIKNSPIVDLTQLLKQEQSIVRLVNNSGDASQLVFSIRGFGDNAVANSLILVDGFPLTNPSLLAPNFNSIPLLDIQKMEITQGSEGVLWGDQAVGGVVSITTRHPEKKLFEANAGIGSFNKQYYSLFAGSKFLHGIFIKAFGYTNRTDNYRDHNHQTDENLTAQAGIDYALGTISLNAQAYEDNTQFPGGLTQAQYDENPRQAIYDSNYMHLKTTLFQLLNKHALNDDWILETRLERQTTLGNGLMFSDFNREDIEDMYRFRFVGTLNHYKIMTGYEGQTNYYDFANTLIDEQDRAQQNNLFARLTAPFVKNTEVIVGARAAWQYNTAEPAKDEIVSSLNKTMVSELGLAYSADNKWKYFARRNGNFRFPKANEETWLSTDNESLKLQTGVSYEIGGERTTEKQVSKINIYQLELTNEIAFNPAQTTDLPFGSYYNFDKTVRRGVTLVEYLRLLEKVSLNAQFNVVDARFTSGEYSGNKIPAVPSINGNLGLDYDFKPDWRFKYIALYNGSAYASDNDKNIGSKIPPYWINTVAFQYIKKKYNISFEIMNLFDKTYSSYTLYNIDTNSNIYYPGSGRSFLLTFKIDSD